MKKYIKRLLVFVLCFAFVFTVQIPAVYAAGSNDDITEADIETTLTGSATDMLNTAKNTPEALGFTDYELKDAYIGNYFKVAKNDKDALTEVNDIIYFPIISEDNIIAILTMIKYDGTISCTIGKDFATELNEYVNNVTGESALYSSSGDIIGISPSDESITIFDVLDERTQVRINQSVTEITYEDVAKDSNVVSKNELLTHSYSLPDNSSPTARAASSYNYLTNFPIVYQGSLPICWAASTAAMVMFEMPQIGELYATTVCNKIGHSYTGGYDSDVVKALKAYLPSIYAPTIYSRAMTVDEVQVIINNVDPAYMHSYDVNKQLMDHATSLCGYAWYGSTFQIRLMDSAYECFKFSTYSGGTFRFAFGSTQYQWYTTVRLLYN